MKFPKWKSYEEMIDYVIEKGFTEFPSYIKKTEEEMTPEGINNAFRHFFPMNTEKQLLKGKIYKCFVSADFIKAIKKDVLLLLFYRKNKIIANITRDDCIPFYVLCDQPSNFLYRGKTKFFKKYVEELQSVLTPVYFLSIYFHTDFALEYTNNKGKTCISQKISNYLTKEAYPHFSSLDNYFHLRDHLYAESELMIKKANVSDDQREFYYIVNQFYLENVYGFNLVEKLIELYVLNKDRCNLNDILKSEKVLFEYGNYYIGEMLCPIIFEERIESKGTSQVNNFFGFEFGDIFVDASEKFDNILKKDCQDYLLELIYDTDYNKNLEKGLYQNKTKNAEIFKLVKKLNEQEKGTFIEFIKKHSAKFKIPEKPILISRPLGSQETTNGPDYIMPFTL